MVKTSPCGTTGLPPAFSRWWNPEGSAEGELHFTNRKLKPDDDGPPSLDLLGHVMCEAFAQKFCEVLHMIGAPGLVAWSAFQNVRRLCDSDNELAFASKCKAFCESFMARLVGTAHKPVGLQGAFERWLRPRIRHGISVQTIGRFQTLFRCKHLMGYASERMVESTIETHVRNTCASKADDSLALEICSAIAPVLEKMMRGMREDFELPHLSTPAKSTGSVESTRTVAGKSGRLIRAFHGVRKKGRPDEIVEAWYDYLGDSCLRLPLLPVDKAKEVSDRPRFDHIGLGFHTLDRACVWEEPRTTVEARFMPDGTYEFFSMSSFDKTEQEWNAFVLREAISDCQSGRSKTVKVGTVIEFACKVRTVSSGTSAGATWATMWQQIAFKAMKRLGCFPSLGAKVTALEVNRVLEGAALAGSSDFKSASDLLNPTVSNWILDFLTNGFPGKAVVMDDNADKLLKYPAILRPATEDEIAQGEFRTQECWHWEDGTIVSSSEWLSGRVVRDVNQERWLCAIADNELIEPLRKGDRHGIRGNAMGLYRDGDFVCLMMERDWMKAYRIGRRTYTFIVTRPVALKKCGQLMGQATSFPLLCLINLACTIAAFRRHGIGWKEALRRVIINGDDRLANTTHAIEDTFWEIANTVGLVESAGKSHRSESYASINSQDYVKKGGIWVRAWATRVHLIYGLKKLQMDEFKPAEVVTALFESVPRWWEVRTVQTFLKYHGKTIEKAVRGRNLFLPVSIGGFGQERPSCWPMILTDYQKAIAGHFMGTTPFFSYQMGPQRFPVPSERPTSSNPWDQVEAVRGGPQDLGAAELTLFSKRFNFRELSQIATERVWQCTCSVTALPVPVGKNCQRCHRGRRICSAGAGKTRVYDRIRRCTECYGPWGYKGPSGTWCTHSDSDITCYEYVCDCHGVLDPVRQRPREYRVSDSDILAASRPTLVADRQRRCNGERRKDAPVRADPLQMPWKIPIPEHPMPDEDVELSFPAFGEFKVLKTLHLLLSKHNEVQAASAERDVEIDTEFFNAFPHLRGVPNPFA